MTHSEWMYVRTIANTNNGVDEVARPVRHRQYYTSGSVNETHNESVSPFVTVTTCLFISGVFSDLFSS